MLDLALIVEDVAQEKFVGRLAARICRECGFAVNISILSARLGFPKVLGRVEDALAEWVTGQAPLPHGVIIAADSNCQGVARRRNQILKRAEALREQLILAVPNPHVERWFLIDSHAFKEVLGRGCMAPDEKCDKDRYKRLLAQAVRDAGIDPLIGGIEYAEDLADALDLDRAEANDESLGSFIRDLRAFVHRVQEAQGI